MGEGKKENMQRETLTVWMGFGIIQTSSKQEFICRYTVTWEGRAAADCRGFCTVMGTSLYRKK